MTKFADYMRIRRYNIRFFALLIILLFSYSAVKGDKLRSCDLIFVGSGQSDFSQAIADATSQEYEKMRFVHVGIIEVNDSNINVIEASPQEGVRIIDLKDFLRSAPSIEGKPAVEIKRCIIDFPIEETIQRAKGFLGEPYDWWYMPDNGKMYCSELVYESFLDQQGKPIFEAQPMNFRAKDGSMPQFWIDLFEKIGESIPEGAPGTNPSDLSKSKKLIRVIYP